MTRKKPAAEVDPLKDFDQVDWSFLDLEADLSFLDLEADVEAVVRSLHEGDLIPPEVLQEWSKEFQTGASEHEE